MAALANDPLTRRNYLRQRVTNLRSERSTWEPGWRDIATYENPELGQFIPHEVNQGARRDLLIYDTTPTFSIRTLAAGMMSGMTSPARPWFKLGLHDKQLANHQPVKLWLNQCEVIMRAVYAASNTYYALHTCYEELGTFGTWADILLPNFHNVIHHYPLTIGEYCLAQNAEGKVDTLTREFRMTVGQLVGMFGYNKVSSTAKESYDRGRYDAYLDVIHIIQPRRNRDTRKADSLNMAWESIYFEPAKDNYELYLRESGFRKFPALCPRWMVKGGAVYGKGPGHSCLGHSKQLHFETNRKSMVIDLESDPPLQVPTTYKDAAQNRLPGGIMYVDQTTPGGGIRAAYEVKVNLEHLRGSIEDIRQQLRNGFYTDLFLMLANDTRSGTTATEIAERHEEKLQMLGPVLESVDGGLLSPLVDMTFDACVAADIFPPPPKDLQEGMNIEVEFISILAQAQRMVSTSGTQRVAQTVTQLAPLVPGVLDKLDWDAFVDDMADAFSINPALIIATEEANKVRAARQAKMEKAQALQAGQQLAETAKTASAVQPNNLKDLMSSLQGYSVPQPG